MRLADAVMILWKLSSEIALLISVLACMLHTVNTLLLIQSKPGNTDV